MNGVSLNQSLKCPLIDSIVIQVLLGNNILHLTSRSASSDTHKKIRRSKRSKQSHKRRRRRSKSSSSSSSSTQSDNGYGRYKRLKQTLQVAEVPTTLHPAEPINVTPNLQPENVVHQPAKDSASDSEPEVWSFDRAINKVLDSYPKNYALRLSRNRLPLSHFLGLST